MDDWLDLFQQVLLTISRRCGRATPSSVSEVVANDWHHIHRSSLRGQCLALLPKDGRIGFTLPMRAHVSQI